MDDIHQHPVFFESHRLHKEQRKVIENYFRIRRKSGGGECVLRSVKDNVYCILFKNQQDQQRVLQKSKHVVEFVDGPLVITVQSSLEPHTSSTITTSTPGQDFTASAQVAKSVQEDLLHKEFTKDVCQTDQASLTKRIVLLGKTGAGKSSLVNTIFGEELFKTNHSANSGTRTCEAETRSVNGRSITLIETPGLFEANRNEEELKPEIVRCITECAPGPHAFLIVLKVEKFTDQEQAVITKICQYFSEDALKYAVVVFTHGDQLREGMNIQEFVSQNEKLSDLVKKCGGRCHVFDNKYWKNKEYNYRSNPVQVAELLKTVDKIINANKENYYTNEMLQAVKREIQMEKENIRQSSPNMSQEKIRNKATKSVFERLLIRFTGITTGLVLGALLGMAEMVTSFFTKSPVQIQSSSDFAALVLTHGIKERVLFAAKRGGVKGGRIGYSATEVAENPMDAVQLSAEAVWNQFE